MNIDDNFFHAFNSSRCKTAMLVISVIVTLGFVVSECAGNTSDSLRAAELLVIGYWSGRTSKAKDK